MQKTNLENKEQITQLKEAFEKANIANQKRDEETHKLIKQFMLENEKKISKLEEDLNAYKKVKHGKDNEVEEARKTMKLVIEKLTTNKL